MRIRNTPIAVDEFTFIPGVYIYLLSHLHSDHTAGLTPSWNTGTVYTSPVTRALLLHRFRLQDPSLVVPLSENVPHTVPLDPHRSVTMQVTLIDANHCPGACMFLLDGYFGRILVTGDFRYTEHLLPSIPRHPPVDVLYLDDTFLDPRADLPPRDQAGHQILDLIDRYPPHTQVLIGMDHLGKEELLVSIALRFRTLIVVTEERLRDIRVIQSLTDLPDLFTHHPADGRVHVLPRRRVSHRSVAQANQQSHKSGTGCPVIGIIPSGWAATQPGPDTDAPPRRLPALQKAATTANAFTATILPRTNEHDNDSQSHKSSHGDDQKKSEEGGRVHIVPYSSHSSYRELETFVSEIRPYRMVSTSRGDTPALLRSMGHLLRDEESQHDSSLHNITIPRPVKLAMDAKKLSLDIKNTNSSFITNISQPSSASVSTSASTSISSLSSSKKINLTPKTRSASRSSNKTQSRLHYPMHTSRGAKISNHQPASTTPPLSPSSTSNIHKKSNNTGNVNTKDVSPPISPIQHDNKNHVSNCFSGENSRNNYHNFNIDSPTSDTSEGLLEGLFGESDGELSVAAEAALVDLSHNDHNSDNDVNQKDHDDPSPPRKRLRLDSQNSSEYIDNVTPEHSNFNQYTINNDIDENNNNNGFSDNFSDTHSFQSLLSLPTDIESYDNENYISSPETSSPITSFEGPSYNNNSPMPDLSLSLIYENNPPSQDTKNDNNVKI
eukprot:gb/GECH01014787.1/.p1 GENE.gb/GECH01014787.1/~~gb/GECH01014787.1/.p1  ORF type:complete len:722 (+),score=156.25 gb/GECH01014787.1/:1-2166(+)